MGTNGRNLGGQLDSLGDLHLASLKRALEVNVTDLVAEVGLGRDKADQAVLDGQQDVCTLINRLLDHTLGLDDQLLATIEQTSQYEGQIRGNDDIGARAGGETNARGGFGARSTLFISMRSSSCFPGHSSRGDSPGTLRSSFAIVPGAWPLAMLIAATGATAAVRHATTAEKRISDS